jgi:hypothetical protein
MKKNEFANDIRPTNIRKPIIISSMLKIFGESCLLAKFWFWGSLKAPAFTIHVTD